MSKIKKVIDYINNTNTHFTVKMIKSHVNDGYVLYESTIHNYINYLHLSEYIKKINRGLYIKIENIPSDLTVSELKFMAYDENYKIRRDRKKKLDKLLNKS